MTNAIERLREYGYELPAPKAPVASYVPVSRSGNILYVSGQISSNEAGVVMGLLGDTMNVVQGANAAELAAINVLSQIANVGGVPLDEIKQILKVTVLVASTPDFTEQHLVANGCSNLLVTVLGDKGKHARAAFGVASLPFGAAVEIEAVVEV
ncbi:RidA family protein [Devosia sp. RR2S18]|jgi:enamine deaminase RidA (YjgF/YER057c/UK114 family)|uniref:RidA family protein n=1 Tax=Devosia rhizosphaerae TaxID=3049774 RepID=UPI002540B2A8|nr:RidA family protein [Devosia sp. RR2S18]WIJ23666.1 RidA family protein [Devosia sp. RR2S18]HEV7292147.1 RidA family protein [Devosia sp.]